MTRTSLSLAGGLAAALLLATAPTAHAAVTAKDAPSESDIVKLYPELAGGEFSTDKSKQISVPGKTCGAPGSEKAKSVVSTTGASAAGFPLVAVAVAETKSESKAKGYLKAYKKYVKACPSFTEPTTGATVTASLAKAPKLGDEALTVVQETSIMGITSYSSSILVRDGKRVASVSAIDDAAVSASSLKKLAKVAAKKMK